MSNLKQLKNRIETIKSTQKITKAMHVVSAAKLQKVKEDAEHLNECSRVLSEIITDISKSDNLSDLTEKDRIFFNKSLNDIGYLFVVITSQRGLCGGFNANIIRRVRNDIKHLQREGKKVSLLIIGKKGYESLKGKYSKIIRGYYDNDKNKSSCLVRVIRNKIIELIESQELTHCYVYYNRFKNVMTQVLTKECILPVETLSSNSDNISEYQYEGDDLIKNVVNLYINSVIGYSLLQSNASEEGARMTAMDDATKNAGELIDKLTLKLNRSRQSIITTELVEIISGAEAL